MSEVNLNFSIVPVEANLLVTTNDITFTPTPIDMTMYLGGIGTPGGVTSEVQYNAGGVLGGITGATSTGTGISFASNTNIKISGGSAGQALTTDGAGNLSFSTVTTTPGGSTTQLQYNNGGSFAGIPNVTFTGGNLRLGPVGNVKITGGTNGYVLQTDGTGNLAWAAGAGGNGAVGGSNTQVQYNNAGLFAGTSAFTFDNTTNTLAVTNLVSSIVTSSQPNITSLGTLTSVTTSGNLSVSGTTSVQQAKEKLVIVGSAPTATTNFDVLSGAINYYTANMTANITLNVRGNSTTTFNSITSVGDSVTIALVTTTGVSVFLPTTFRIDSVTITPKYVGNTAPNTGLLQSAGVNAYTYTIIKTATSTYTVLGSYAGYK